MSSQANHHAHNAIPGLAQRQPVHDHTRPLPPPIPSPFSTGQTTTNSTNTNNATATASFRSVSRSPVPQTSSPSSQSIHRIVVANTSASITSSTGSNNAADVSLEAPRPDGERLANEYVDTPFRPNTQQQPQHPHQQHQQHQQHHQQQHQQQQQQQQQQHHQQQQQQQSQQPQQPQQPQQQQQQQQNKGHATNKHHQRHRHHHSSSKQCLANKNHGRSGGPITKQPVSFTKEPSPRGSNQPSPGNNAQADSSGLSIMCDRCGKCRCESCREPPPLPSRWLCDNACYCSAETVLDYATCLCCAKGLFYHCSTSNQDEGTTCADTPCSCTGPRRVARWSCLTALALVLPCLLCYWPLKGCVALCETCYAKHANQGCRCEQPELGEKRLLAPEP